MKAKLKTTFERYGVIGRIEDAEMYRKVKNGISHWEATAYPRITHIQIPKEVFERLLELDRSSQKQSEVIDEFANRLKEKMNDLSRMEYNCVPYFLVSKSFINKIAEEMKGGE